MLLGLLRAGATTAGYGIRGGKAFLRTPGMGYLGRPLTGMVAGGLYGAFQGNEGTDATMAAQGAMGAALGLAGGLLALPGGLGAFGRGVLSPVGRGLGNLVGIRSDSTMGALAQRARAGLVKAGVMKGTATTKSADALIGIEPGTIMGGDKLAVGRPPRSPLPSRYAEITSPLLPGGGVSVKGSISSAKYRAAGLGEFEKGIAGAAKLANYTSLAKGSPGAVKSGIVQARGPSLPQRYMPAFPARESISSGQYRAAGIVGHAPKEMTGVTKPAIAQAQSLNPLLIPRQYKSGLPAKTNLNNRLWLGNNRLPREAPRPPAPAMPVKETPRTLQLDNLKLARQKAISPVSLTKGVIGSNKALQRSGPHSSISRFDSNAPLPYAVRLAARAGSAGLGLAFRNPRPFIYGGLGAVAIASIEGKPTSMERIATIPQPRTSMAEGVELPGGIRGAGMPVAQLPANFSSMPSLHTSLKRLQDSTTGIVQGLHQGRHRQ